MRKEYKILSSRTGGINEVYKNIDDVKKRYEYIKSHQDEFKSNSMIYVYVNVYNDEGKIKDWKTLAVLKLGDE